MATMPPPPSNHSLSALDLQFDRLSLGGQNNIQHQLPHQILPVNKLDIPRRRGIVKFFSQLQSRLLRYGALVRHGIDHVVCWVRFLSLLADSLKGFGFVVDNDPGALGGQEGKL